MKAPVITLSTDFGADSWYVGQMKGVILSIAPQARLVDLDHTIEPQNVLGAAFLLDYASAYFPNNTIHVCVVDPGVGTDRKVIAARTDKAFFVAPDNGTLSVVLARHDDVTTFEVTNTDLFLDNVSDTCHCRDVFAPLAAHLAAGCPINEVGPELDDPYTISWQTRRDEGGGIRGQVVRIDRYGNLITNILEEELLALKESKPGVLADTAIGVGGRRIETFVATYSDAGPGEPVFYIGSTGYVEIAEPLGHAAERLKASVGDEVVCW